jgi:hypothetical protein
LDSGGAESEKQGEERMEKITVVDTMELQMMDFK